ncbi:MAG: A/G-specific adenine glycosylase [Pseudomonadota bacterium]
MEVVSELSTALLKWYDNHARQLPWRVSPYDRANGIRPDPYRVWLSEIMLQQTTVATVKDYFLKFVSQWPDVEALANASEDDVLRAWAGLGYYSRARNLKKCADIIVRDHGGVFPADLAGLRALPGIGDYTSAAIASIAFDIDAAVMDGNVERVFSRLFAIDTPLPAAKPEIKAKVAANLDKNRPGDFAQATMDLGATICSPKKPACMHCPLGSQCKALATIDPESLPIKAPKKARPQRVGAAFVAVSPAGSIIVEKRPPTGLLASMTQVPTTQWNSRIDGDTSAKAAPFSAHWEHCGSVTHIFTHFELKLTVWRANDVEAKGDDQRWVPIDQAKDEAFPTVMKKAIECAIPDIFKARSKIH